MNLFLLAKALLKELFLPIAPGIKIFPTKDDMKFNAAEITPKKTGDLKVVSWQHLGVNLGRKSNINLFHV